MARFDLLRLAVTMTATAALCVHGAGRAAAQAVPDGRTSTSVAVSGVHSDVTTGTISGGYGINSFSSFDVAPGASVFLHAPAGTAGTVNIVAGSMASTIHGAVVGMQAGAEGGAVHIANPNGIVLGPEGTIRAGVVGLSTPSRAFIDAAFATGAPDPAAIGRIVDGTAPREAGADIALHGAVHATERVTIRVGRDLALFNGARVTAGAGGQGGAVDMRAGRDITLHDGAAILAEGTGAGDGGFIFLFADGAARLERGAVISASALGDGDGGFLEFSAEDLVEVRGVLRAHAAGAGTHGLVFIDPRQVLLASDFTGGGNLSVLSTSEIVVGAGVTLNTRAVADGGDPETDASVANSGSISLTAPTIRLEEGARLIAWADNGHAAGNISLIATESGPNPLASARIILEAAELRGGNVALQVTSSKTISLLTPFARDAFRAALAGSGTLPSLRQLTELAMLEAGALARSLIQENDLQVAGYAIDTEASIILRRSSIDASGAVSLLANATGNTPIQAPDALALILASSAVRASIVVEESVITAGLSMGFAAINLSAIATNTLRLDAGKLAFGAMNTHSTVALRGSTLMATGGPQVQMRSQASETAILSASGRLIGAEPAMSGVVALRDLTSRVLVDAEPGWTGAGSTISGGFVRAEAVSFRSATMTARAADPGDGALALPLSVTVADGQTEALVGGSVSGTGMSVRAAAENRHTAMVAASSGALADAAASLPVPGQDGFDWEDWREGAAALASALEGVEFGPGGGPGIVLDGSGAIALNVERIRSDTHAQFGGQRGGLDLGPAAATLSAAGSVTAADRLVTLSRTTTARSEDPRGLAAVGAISFGNWEMSARAVLGEGAQIIAPALTVSANSSLPATAQPARSALNLVGFGVGADIATDGAALLEAASLLPDLVAPIQPGYWSITSETVAGGTDLGVGLDIGNHAFRVDTRAEIADGVIVAAPTLSVSAQLDGNLLARRLTPVSLVPGTRAAGGAQQRMVLSGETSARLGAVTGPGGAPQTGTLSVIATSTPMLGVFTASFAGLARHSLSGAISIVDYDMATRATISALGAHDGPSVDLRALDSALMLAGAGVGYTSGSRGLGVGRAVVNSSRRVVAGFSANSESLIGAGFFLPAGSPDQRIGSIFIEARTAGMDVASAIAGAEAAGGGTAPGVAADEEEEPADAPAGAAGLASGTAVSADFAKVAAQTVLTAALETGAEISSGFISLRALDAHRALAGAGASVAGAGGLGLGGAAAKVALSGDIVALNRGGSRISYGLDAFGDDIRLFTDITATDFTTARALASGRGGETIRTGVMGSAASLARDGDVIARSRDSVIDAGAGLRIFAHDSGTAYAVAGAVTLATAAQSAGEGDDEDAPDEGGGTARGASVGFASARLAGTRVILGAIDGGGLSGGRADAFLSVTGQSTADLVASALSEGGGAAFGIAGSLVRVDMSGEAAARLTGLSGAAPLGRLSLRGSDAGRLRARIGAEAAGETLGFGGSAVIARDSRTARVLVEDSTLVEPGLLPPGSLVAQAEGSGLFEAFQRAGGGDGEGTASVGVMIADVVLTRETLADIRNSSLALSALTLTARDERRALNRQGAATSGARVTGALGTLLTRNHAETRATIEQSTLAVRGEVVAGARGLGAVVGRAALSGDVPSGIGAQAVIADLSQTGQVAARVIDSDLTATRLDLSAVDGSWRELSANAALGGAGAGGAGAMTFETYERATEAQVSGGSLTVDALDLSALSDTRLSMVALSRARGGTGTAFVGQIAIARDARAVSARLEDVAASVAERADLLAERRDGVLLLQGTEASGSAGGGLGVSIFRQEGTTEARLAPGAAAVAAGTLALRAQDGTRALGFAFGTGSGAGLQGVGAIVSLEMGERPVGAGPLGEDQRSAEERAKAQAALGSALHRSPDWARAAPLASRIEARIAAPEAARLSVDGRIDIDAVDARVATALSGQLQARFVTEALAGLEAGFGITRIDASGVEVRFFDLRVGASGEEIRLTMDAERRDGWALDEALPPSVGTGDVDVPDDVPGVIDDIDDLFDEWGEWGDGEDGESGDGDDDNGGAEDGGAEDDATPGTPEGGAAALDDLAEKQGGEAPDPSSGIGIGAAFAFVNLGGATEAVITLGGGAEVIADDNLRLAASAAHTVVAISAGAQIGGGNAGAGGAQFASFGLLGARVEGPGDLRAADIAITASATGQATVVSTLLLVGTGFQGGATTAITRLDTVVDSRAFGSRITAVSGRVLLRAIDSGSAVTVAGGGGGSTGGTYLGGSLASGSGRGSVLAVALPGTVLAAPGAVEIVALRQADLDNTAVQIALSGGAAVGTGAFSLGRQEGLVAAEAIGAEIVAGGSVGLEATGAGRLAGSAISAALGTGTAISASSTAAVRADTIRATIRGGEVTAGDSVAVQALAGGALLGAGGAERSILETLSSGMLNVAYGGTAGIGASLTVIDSLANVEAAIRDDARVTALGAPGAAGRVTARRREAEGWSPRRFESRHGIAVIADADTRISAAGVTAGGGGTAAVQAQFPILTVADTVRALVEEGAGSQPVLTASSDIAVEAAGSGEISTIALALGIAGQASVGASIEFLRVARTVEARVAGAVLNAGGGISVLAVAPETISTLSISGAFSGVASVGGIVQVMRTESVVRARVRGTLTAGGDVAIRAAAPRSIVQDAGNAAVGIGAAGVSGTILVLNAEDIVLAEVEGAASASAPRRSTIDAAGDVTLEALAPLAHRATVIGAGISGGVGIEASFLIAQFRQTVTARLGAHADLSAGRMGTLVVRARQDFGQDMVMGGVAAGAAAAIGASIAALGMRNAVRAEVGTGAQVTASGRIDIHAAGARSFSGTAATIGGGAFSFGASAIVLGFGRPGEVAETSDHLAVVSAAMSDGNPYAAADGRSLGGGEGVLENAIASAIARRAEAGVAAYDLVGPPDSIHAVVGSVARLTAAGDITLEAVETGEAEALAGAIGVGGVSVQGGIVVIRRGSSLLADLGQGAHLVSTGGDVRLEARADVDRDTLGPLTFAGAAGVAGGFAGAYSRAWTERSLSVLIGDAARIETAPGRRATVAVNELGATRAEAVAGALAGGVAVGATIAEAEHGSTLRIQAGNGVRPTIIGGNATIAIRREGDVEARSTAAAGGLLFGTTATLSLARDRADAVIDLGALRVLNYSATVSGGVLVPDAFRHETVVSIDLGSDVTVRNTSVTLAGGATMGVSIATAERTATASLQGSFVDIATHRLVMRAADHLPGRASEMVARAFSVTGAGVFAGAAGVVDAVVATHADLDLTANLILVTGDADLLSSVRNDVDAQSSGLTGGLVAAGANAGQVVMATRSTLSMDLVSIGTVLGTFSARALGEDAALARVFSGMGGAAVLQAAGATLRITPVTRLRLTGAELRADRAEIVARREIVPLTRGHSLRASVVSVGATWLIVEVSSGHDAGGAGLDVEVGLDITAREIEIAAQNILSRPEDGFNGQIGEIGLIDLTSLLSRIDVVSDIRLSVTGTLSQIGSGSIRMELLEDVDVTDRVKIDTLGAIKFPWATVDTALRARRADIILDGASVIAEGDITVEASARAAITTLSVINVTGAAGRPDGRSLASYEIAPRIVLRGGSVLETENGMVSLLAGGAGQDVAVLAETRVWNGTLLPLTFLSKPRAEARIDISPLLDIRAGSEVISAGDVLLVASRGATDAYALATGSNFYRAVAALASEAFGGRLGEDQTNSFDFVSGEAFDRGRGDVVVDGTVTAGARADQILTISPSGVITVEGNIVPVFRDGVDLAEVIALAIETLEEEAAAAPDDAQLQTETSWAIQRLLRVAAAYEVEGGLDLVTIDGVVARGGRIEILADTLSGSGRLLPQADVRVQIINESPRILELGNITVEERRGASILFNGQSVLSNASLNQINEAAWRAQLGPIADLPGTAPQPVAALDLVIPELTGTVPTLRAINSHNATAGGTPGDLIVSGRLENLGGVAELSTSTGNILILGGEIAARDVNIVSGGDFYLFAVGTDAGLTNLGADPLAQYGAFFARYSDWVAAGANPATRPLFELAAPPAAITASGNVYVYANELNISGPIQAGITDWSLETSEFLTAASLAHLTESTILLTRTGYATEAGRSASSGAPLLSGNISARWDPEAQALRLDPVLTRGGEIELVGRIISTGGGELRAAHGFGHVEIDHRSSLPLIIGDMTTGFGEGVRGVVRIVDTNNPHPQGGFTVSEYRRQDDGSVQLYRYSTDPPPGALFPVFTLSGPVSYQIAAPFALYYDMRETELLTSDYFDTWLTNYSNGAPDLFGTRSPNPVQQLVFSSTTPRVGEESAAILQAQPHAFFREVDLDPDWFSSTGEWVLVEAGRIIFPGFAGIPAVTADYYERRQVNIARTVITETHRIAANRPIGIVFHGHDEGRVEIRSTGEVRVEGVLHNRSGLTAISAAQPSVPAVRPSIFIRADGRLETARLILEAEGSVSGYVRRTPVGAPAFDLFGQRPGLVDIAPGRGLEVRAGGDIRLRNPEGALNLREVVSTNRGLIDLSAAGTIRLHGQAVAGPVISGGEVRLVSVNGALGAEGAPLTLDQGALDLLTASAAGDIFLTSPAGSMRVVSIASRAGDVTLGAALDIIDANSEEIEDRRARDGLLSALWDEIGLRAPGAAEAGDPEARRAELIARHEAVETDSYFDYWNRRGLIWGRPVGQPDAPLRVIGIGPYDPDAVIAYSSEERASLEAQGLDASVIAAMEDELTARFHASHARWGTGGLPVLLYDPDFRYVASAEEVAELTEGLFRSDRELSRGLRAELILPSAETQVRPEAPNITGRDVALVAGASIGTQVGISGDPFVIPPGMQLTENQLARLWAVERDDITLRADGALVVREADDVNVEAAGRFSALAGGDIYVGSRGTLLVSIASGGGNTRLKAGEGLYRDESLGGLGVIRGLGLVLEGGAGGAGTIDAPLLIEQTGSLRVVARAAGDVVLRAVSGNLRLGEVFSAGGQVEIVAPGGSLLDANDDDGPEISASSIRLTAGIGIGSATRALGVTAPDGVLRIDAEAGTGLARLDMRAQQATTAALGSAEGATLLSVDGELTLLAPLPGRDATLFAGTDLALDAARLFASGSGPHLLVPGEAVLTIGGDLGATDAPVIARLGPAASNQSPGGLTITRRAGTGPVSVWMETSGRLSVRGIALGRGGNLLELFNQGTLTLASPFALEASSLSLAALGSGGLLTLQGPVLPSADFLALTATGFLWLEDGATLGTGADTLLRGARVAALGTIGGTITLDGGANLDVIADERVNLRDISASGDVSLRVLGEGPVGAGTVTAASLTASTWQGDVRIGRADVTEDILIEAAGSILGRYAPRGALTLAAGVTLGRRGAEGWAEAVEIETGSAGPVTLSGEWGGDIRVIGRPGVPGALRIDSLTVAGRGTGELRRGDGSLVSLAEALDPDALLLVPALDFGGDPTDPRAAGLRVAAPLLSLDLGNVEGNGADVEVATGILVLSGTLRSGGGAVLLEDTSVLTDMRLDGTIDSAGGAVTIRANRGLDQSGPVRSGGGMLSVEVGAQALAGSVLARIGSLESGGGMLLVSLAPGASLVQATGGLVDAGAGRARILVPGGDAQIASIRSSLLPAAGPAVELVVSGALSGLTPEAPLVTTRPNAFARINAGSWAFGPDLLPLVLAGGAEVTLASGGVQILSPGDLVLRGLSTGPGGVAEVAARGSLRLAGPVRAGGETGAVADLVLSALDGDLWGEAGALRAARAFLGAPKGRVGSDSGPLLLVQEGKVSEWTIFGRDAIDMELAAGSLTAARALSAGPVRLAAPGDVVVALLGSPLAPEIVTGGQALVMSHGEEGLVPTLPEVTPAALEPAAYPLFPVLAPFAGADGPGDEDGGPVDEDGAGAGEDGGGTGSEGGTPAPDDGAEGDGTGAAPPGQGGSADPPPGRGQGTLLDRLRSAFGGQPLPGALGSHLGSPLRPPPPAVSVGAGTGSEDGDEQEDEGGTGPDGAADEA